MQLTVFFLTCLLGVALGKTFGPGQMCTRCNQARDSEDVCNNQDIDGGNEVQCKENEVCTTDVRCDGQGRLFFIKGCEKAAKITAANTLICNGVFTRCNYHCDQGDFCNLNAPPAVWESLVCYDEVTTTTTVTTPTVTTPTPTVTTPTVTTPTVTTPTVTTPTVTTPTVTTPTVTTPGPMCTRCNQARDSEDVCNNQDIEGGNEVQCKENEVCTTDVRCDGQGRLFFIKGCEKAAKITAANTLICNGDFTRCNYHCDQGDFCNLNAPPAVWESLECYDDVPVQGECTPIDPLPEGVDASCQCSCSCDLPPCDMTTTPTIDPSCCTVGHDGPNMVTSYDGTSYPLISDNKFLLSTYVGSSGFDQCKFQIRVDSTEDPPNSGNIVAAWAGIAFGVHNKNEAKYERNFRVSLKQGVVELRGRGYNPTPVGNGCYQTGPYSEPWYFCLDIVSGGVFSITMGVPNLGCDVTVLYEEAGSGGNTSGSDRCKVFPGDYYNGLLTGMCGNMNDDASDEGTFCPGSAVSIGNISDDCIDGDHQNN